MKVLLVGPSSRIKEKDKAFFESFKEQGYTTICYSGGIYHLAEIGFAPDYFSFIDPFTLYYDNFSKYIKINSNFFKQINLLGADIYSNKLDVFKSYNFTSNKFTSAVADSDKYISDIFLYFNKIILCKSKCETLFNVKEEYNFNQEYLMFSGQKRINIDKLFGFLFPLVFFNFKNITNIHLVGFGDFHVPRLANGSTGDYDHYKKSINFLLTPIKNYIIKNNIQLTFEHKNYFSKILNYE